MSINLRNSTCFLSSFLVLCFQSYDSQSNVFPNPLFASRSEDDHMITKAVFQRNGNSYFAKENSKMLFAYRERTHRVTWWPLSRHFSGLGSFCLHWRYATFSDRHLIAMCFEEDISTADVGIGSPAASTALAISNSINSKQENIDNLAWYHRQQNFASTTCQKKIVSELENFKPFNPLGRIP